MAKINLGLLFGGRSCEHEISVVSARSLLNVIDCDKYQVTLIGIDKNGHWQLADDFEALIDRGAVKPLTPLPLDSHRQSEITLALHHGGNLSPVLSSQPSANLPTLDVIFPMLHGTFGEDGTIQGVLEMTGIPYVGCGVAASAVAMDKILAKKLFTAAGISQAAYLEVDAQQWYRNATDVLQCCESKLGYPMFVKPANLGSSIGISKAHMRVQLEDSIRLALRFDNKIAIEQSMENCAEVECAVLGNVGSKERVQASIVGEIIPNAEFYDYTTKYINDKSELVMPASIPERAAERVRQLSIDAFTEIGGAGLARVDFFVDRFTSNVTLSEINTMPGFTSISMYPQLWAASGLPYPKLIDRLITLAIEAGHTKAELQRSFQPPRSTVED